MKFSYCTYVFLFVFFSGTSFCQSPEQDSIQAALINEINCEIAQLSTIDTLDKSTIYDLLQSSLEIRDTAIFFKLSLYVSREYYYRLSKHQECIPFLEKCEGFLNNKTSSAGSHNLHLGNHYLAMGNKVSAMENYLKSLEWYRKYNPIRATLPLFNLANIYEEIKDYESSLDLRLEALSYSKLLPEDQYKAYNLVYDYVDISNLYQKIGNLDLANDYIQKSLKIASKDESKNVKITAIEQAISFYNSIDSNHYTLQLIEKGDSILSLDGLGLRPHIKERFILNKSHYYLKMDQIEMAIHPRKLDKNNLVSEEDRLKYTIRYYENTGDKKNEIISYKQLLAKRNEDEENYSKIVSTVLENKEEIKELNSNSEESLSIIAILKKRLLYLVILILGLFASVFFYRKQSSRLEKKIQDILSINTFNINKLKRYREASKHNKQYFVAVAHDIRSPMMKLKLLNEQLHSKEKKDIDSLISESQLLNKEIDTMLNQLEHFLFKQKKELTKIENIDLEMLFKDCSNLIDPSIIKPFNLKIIGTNIIKVNRSDLKAIFKNCIENSMKYCNADFIEFIITVNREDGNYTFSFTDNNIISSTHKIEKSSLEESSNNIKNYGLGLEICKLSAERLGGWFKVDENYNKGFKVDFSLS